MANKIFDTLTKAITTKIAWFGAGMAGVTAVLSAVGFLVIRAHHDLLGITGLVPTPSDTWTIEGARFVYNSLLLLFSNPWSLLICVASGLLIALAGYEHGVRWIRKCTAFSVVRFIFVVISLAALVATMAYFLHDEGISHLLVSPRPLSAEIQGAIQARTDAAEIKTLRVHYAQRAAMVIFLFVWLKLLPHFFYKEQQEPSSEVTSSSPVFSFWYGTLWFLFLILAFLLPTKYGKMVTPNRYFKVCLLSSIEDATVSGSSCAGHAGWLLHKDSQEIVLYRASSPSKPVQIFKQGQFQHIQILTFDSIFSALPSQSATPAKPTPTPGAASPSPGQAVLDVGKMLRNIPETIAAGILEFTGRGISALRILIIADKDKGTLNSFTPFQEDESGYIQSPVWLPNDRILFVEVHGATSTLQAVSTDFKNTDEYFGSSPIEGWEPHLSPDAQSVVFRQGTTIMKANLEGTQIVPLRLDTNVEQILGVFPDTDGESYYLVFSEGEKVTGERNLWIASILGDSVLSLKPASDDERWRLLAHMKFHNGHMLYEQQDEKDGKSVWNIYLSESFEKESRPLTNTQSDAKLFNNRYPAWNPDGTNIVYVSE